MKNYHKINGLYKRYTEGENKGRFIVGDYSKPEFEYLLNNQWVGTEKIDGTNIKIHWDGDEILFGGKTDKSDIPTFLREKLWYYVDRWENEFPEVFFVDEFGTADVTLYFEGYGNRIQKVGKHYIPNGVDIILFDIMIKGSDGKYYYLKREDVDSVAELIGVKSVPVVFKGTIPEGIEFVKKGFQSLIGTCEAEGLVAVPEYNLLDRSGARIITKLKTRDFRENK